MPEPTASEIGQPQAETDSLPPPVTTEPIISEPQMDFLQKRGREIGAQLVEKGVDCAVYLDRSARPLRRFVDAGIRENRDESTDIRNYFVAIGAEQVRGYLQYLYDMRDSADPAEQKKFRRAFSYDWDMYLNNLFAVEGIGRGYPSVNRPDLRPEVIRADFLMEYFDRADVQRIQDAIRKRSAELGGKKDLRVAIVDDLIGSGLTSQFAASVIGMLAPDGIRVNTQVMTLLGPYEKDPNSTLFREPDQTKPYMPWKEGIDWEGNVTTPAASFVEEQGDNRLLVGAQHRIAGEEVLPETARGEAAISIKRARQLYQEILTRLRG